MSLKTTFILNEKIEDSGNSPLSRFSLEHKAIPSTVTGAIYQGEKSVCTFNVNRLSKLSDKKSMAKVLGIVVYESYLEVNWNKLPGDNHCVVSYECLESPK